jgi:hypothetical protein
VIEQRASVLHQIGKKLFNRQLSQRRGFPPTWLPPLLTFNTPSNRD